MADLIATGLAWLDGQREKHMAAAVSYIRNGGGPIGSVDSATIGKTVFRLSGDYGATIRIETKDFIISVDQLPDDPEPGDTIEHDGQEYEVNGPGGEPSWRWTDGYRRSRRIHTIHIGPA